MNMNLHENMNLNLHEIAPDQPPWASPARMAAAHCMPDALPHGPHPTWLVPGLHGLHAACPGLHGGAPFL
jgi:hypothetical protein